MIARFGLWKFKYVEHVVNGLIGHFDWLLFRGFLWFYSDFFNLRNRTDLMLFLRYFLLSIILFDICFRYLPHFFLFDCRCLCLPHVFLFDCRCFCLQHVFLNDCSCLYNLRIFLLDCRFKLTTMWNLYFVLFDNSFNWHLHDLTLRTFNFSRR